MRAAALLLVALVAAGCTSQEQEPPVASPPAASSPTPSPPATATEPTAPTQPAPVPLEFGGSTGATIDAECGDPAPAYLATYQALTVNLPVELGEVSLVGGGRLVGDVTLAPSRTRADAGALVAGDEPGYAAAITRLPGWEQRAPLAGQAVQPGTYTVFAQVRLAPGDALEALELPWSASDSTGSSRLPMPVAVVERCGDG